MAEFDQKIDTKEILSVIKVTVGKSKNGYCPLRLATWEEAENDVSLRQYLLPSLKDRYFILFTVTKPLPYKSTIQVTIGPKVK